MLASLIRRRWPIALGAVALVVLALSGALAASGGGNGDASLAAGEVPEGGDPAARVVVYNGRSHYGDEDAFVDFEKKTGIQVELRGGTAPELFERLRREGEDTPADLLVTTDLANLWRAEEAGLLQNVSTPPCRPTSPRGCTIPRARGGR